MALYFSVCIIWARLHTQISERKGKPDDTKNACCTGSYIAVTQTALVAGKVLLIEHGQKKARVTTRHRPGRELTEHWTESYDYSPCFPRWILGRHSRTLKAYIYVRGFNKDCNVKHRTHRYDKVGSLVQWYSEKVCQEYKDRIIYSHTYVHR